MTTRLNALEDRASATDAFGLTNYDNLQADVDYLVKAGASLASLGLNNTLAITNEFHHVTLAGGNDVDNISDLIGASPGQQVRLLFDNAQTIRNNGGPGGNIRTKSGSDRGVSADEVVTLVYDGTTWREQGGSSGLNHYTQAAWPPAAGSAFAVLADNYGNFGTWTDTAGALTQLASTGYFAIPLQWYPASAGGDDTYPWRVENGDTEHGLLVQVMRIDGGAQVSERTLQIPLAGVFDIDLFVAGGSLGGGTGTCTVRLGTSTGATDIGSQVSNTAGNLNTCAGAGTLTNKTFTKGEILYLSGTKSASSMGCSLIGAVFRPKKLANA